MDIKHVFEDPRIVMLEEDIARINEHRQYDEEEKHVVKHLLKERQNMLWQLNVYDDEMKRLFTDFNAALRKACTELYRRTMATYQEYRYRGGSMEDFAVYGKIFLSYDYPECHPVQTERAKRVWDVLTQRYFCAIYDDGCTWPLSFCKKYPPEQSGFETMEAWLGMEAKKDNWNEGLDREWSKGLHLIYPFHNLYDHCYFSLYDLIYVREFNLEVTVGLEDRVKY